MRAVLVLIAMFSLAASPALADAALEARVLRLEAQVKALQESLKNAVQINRAYNVKPASGLPDSCLSSASADPAPAKSEVFLAKCRAPDDRDNSQRNWKVEPALP
jgi:hypothetical protein